jgi:hypothetical protein
MHIISEQRIRTRVFDHRDGSPVMQDVKIHRICSPVDNSSWTCQLPFSDNKPVTITRLHLTLWPLTFRSGFQTGWQPISVYRITKYLTHSVSVDYLNIAALFKHALLDSFKEINLTEWYVKYMCGPPKVWIVFLNFSSSSRKILNKMSETFLISCPLWDNHWGCGVGALSLPGFSVTVGRFCDWRSLRQCGVGEPDSLKDVKLIRWLSPFTQCVETSGRFSCPVTWSKS